ELMQCATPIALPQPNGQESLNVAIAGSLCLYETLRQRKYATL
ncbi:MAG: RNA methyltransferase, partial [Psychrobacter celer]